MSGLTNSLENDGKGDRFTAGPFSSALPTKFMFQEQRGLREHGDDDDSWSTCVAMICGVSNEAIPNFVVEAIRATGYPGAIDLFPLEEANVRWIDYTNAWLAKLDPPRELKRLDTADPERRKTLTFNDIAFRNRNLRYGIIVGQSPRGKFRHSIVIDLQRFAAGASDGNAYDPHPSGDGIGEWWQVWAIVPERIA